ncbi:acetylxylan esterase [Ruania zhangjianzhongii]|uniref:glucuronyl esterase domain-containing protein n=1 Tax=Ruania zhangjianzhongii TaxID=2603206 RepID=UPI0011CB3841|nr:acetylxylan esterase [Ruania zhangjianzhongii]
MTVLAEPEIGYPQHRTTWENVVRPQVMAQFRDEIYGRVPEGRVELDWRLLEEGRAPGGAIRRQIAVTLSGPLGTLTVTVLVHLPVQAGGVPAYLGLNFRGNHTCTLDDAVLRTGIDHPAQTGQIHYDGLREAFEIPPARGSHAHRWPLERIAERGYAAITVSYLQVGPDHAGIFSSGLHTILSSTGSNDRPAEEWGAIGMWAWTLSRLQDALEKGMVPEVDPARVTVVGHSRLGKTALWAAATDPRFAAAISNDSGCLGAALSRPVGETPEVLARIRPYWFARAFSSRVLEGRPLPVDQHQLIACIAPRPVYVASASEDDNADPEGEFLSWRAAARVWELYGYPRPSGGFPAPGGTRENGRTPLGYHLRPGEHSIERFDWEHWLDFCDRWVPERPSR